MIGRISILIITLGLIGISLWYKYSNCEYFNMVELEPSEELFMKNIKFKLAGKPLPEVKITHRDVSKYLSKNFWGEVPINSKSYLPSIFDEFSKKYKTSDYTDQLCKNLIKYISLKTKQLGENPEDIEKCLELTYRYVNEKNPLSRIPMLPCYAEMARNKNKKCWILIFNWEIFPDSPLDHYKKFVVDIKTKQIIRYSTCE